MEKNIEATATVVEEITTEKPYKFRRLAAEDVFPMFKIISKIGIKEVKTFIEGDGFKDVLKGFSGDAGNEKDVERVGLSIFIEIADLLLRNLPKCEEDMFKLLSSTSNLTVEQVRQLDLATFAEMIIEFVKKEEFGDFIKVVSKLFK
jgi:hypothetical protein